MRKTILCFAFATLVLLGTDCTRSAPTPNPVAQFLSHFPTHSEWPDTLHCYLAESPAYASISDTLLKTVLDSVQFSSLHFDTGDARYEAIGQFSFTKGLSAALVLTQEGWFGKQSMLVFDLQQQKCVAVVELSHFYGGDGGQTASESWLFRHKTPLQLFIKSAEHGLRVSLDPAAEPQEYLQESGQLFQWDTNQFNLIPNPDSMLFLQRYAMHRTW